MISGRYRTKCSKNLTFIRNLNASGIVVGEVDMLEWGNARIDQPDPLQDINLSFSATDFEVTNKLIFIRTDVLIY